MQTTNRQLPFLPLLETAFAAQGRSMPKALVARLRTVAGESRQHRMPPVVVGVALDEDVTDDEFRRAVTVPEPVPLPEHTPLEPLDLEIIRGSVSALNLAPVVDAPGGELVLEPDTIHAPLELLTPGTGFRLPQGAVAVPAEVVLDLESAGAAQEPLELHAPDNDLAALNRGIDAVMAGRPREDGPAGALRRKAHDIFLAAVEDYRSGRVVQAHINAMLALIYDRENSVYKLAADLWGQPLRGARAAP